MSAQQVQCKPTAQPKSWFVWDVPDQPVAIRMDIYAIQSLAFLTNRAFKSVPKRGLEIGGLLLGSVVPDSTNPSRCTVSIEDFEAVDSVHQYGPSWLLSDVDRLALLESLERRRTAGEGARVVGFFRSNSRPDFEFDTQDRELFGQNRNAAAPVFLLIRPSNDAPPFARIGVRSAGSLSGVATFPLNVPMLHAGGAVVTDEISAPVTPQAAVPAPVTTVVQKAPAPTAMPWYRNTARVFWSICTVASATFALVLARPHVPPVINEATPAAVNASPLDSGLSDAPGLLSGTPNSAEKPEPYSSTPKLAESPAAVTAALKPRRTGPSLAAASHLPGGDVTLSEAAGSKTPSASSTAPPPPEPQPVPRPSPFAAAPPKSAPPAGRIESEVTVEPVGPSLPHRLVSKVNPLRWTGLRGRSKAVAAQPILQVQPTISPQLAKRARGEEEVDVKVLVEEDGRVTRADVVYASGEGVLADPARAAVLRWKFQPARIADRPVASSVIVHFRFNVQPAAAGGVDRADTAEAPDQNR